MWELGALSGSDGEASRQAGQLWQLATALSAAGTAQEVASAVAEQGASAADAVFGNVALVDDSGTRLRAVHGSSLDSGIAARWSEFDIEAPTPLGDAILTGKPVLLESQEAIGESYPALLADTVTAGLHSTASLPLSSRGGPVQGAIGIGWSEPQEFTESQLSRLRLMAELTAEALLRVMTQPQTGRVEADRRQARVLQDALLPSVLPNTERLEVAAAYLPASNAPIGGDWYDVFPVDGGTCLVIGDVVGHGVRSVAVMAELRHAVRAFADEDGTPARVVARVNRMLCRQHPRETATMIVSVWDADQRTLTRTVAGHPPVLLCGHREPEFLTSGAGNGPLMGVEPEWRYDQQTEELPERATLLFYTDGLIEARKESLGLSMRRLQAFVRSQEASSPQALCDEILLWRLLQGACPDDVCVMAASLT